MTFKTSGSFLLLFSHTSSFSYVEVCQALWFIYNNSSNKGGVKTTRIDVFGASHCQFENYMALIASSHVSVLPSRLARVFVLSSFFLVEQKRSDKNRRILLHHSSDTKPKRSFSGRFLVAINRRSRALFWLVSQELIMMHPYIQSICRPHGDVSISIVGDNAVTHAKPVEKRPQAGLRRCSTAPDLRSKRFQRQGRLSSLDDSTLCRWESNPTTGSSRTAKDSPPVLKRSIPGPPVMPLRKSTSLTAFAPLDKPPKYTRPSYANGMVSMSSSTLVIIKEVLESSSMDTTAHDVIDSIGEVPEEALSF